MGKTKKMAILAIIAMVLTMMPVALFAATPDIQRIAGADRVKTALEVCEAGWKSADTIILAPADQPNLVDALAAAPLAGQEDAPILLTFKGSLDPAVKARISKLGAKKVYVIGAISNGIQNEIASLSGITVVKLAGSNRIATARAITAELDAPAGTFVVGIEGLADALSVASYAAANNFAIAIANPDGSIAKSDLVGKTTYIVGGKTRVKDINGVQRFAGNDRFATNAKVAEELSFKFDNIYVANGATLVDALSVAPLAAKKNSFVLLCSTTKVTPVKGITEATKVIAVGGSTVVPNGIINRVVPTEDGTNVKVSVQAPNLIQLKLEFSSTDYDAEAVADVDNYDFKGYIKDSLTRINVVEAEAAGTTVTLTLKAAVDNRSKGTLTIDEAVSGKELTIKDIEFLDKVIPTVKNVKVIGKNIVKVIFSEPMIASADMDEEFELEMGGREYRVEKVTALNHGFEANITVNGRFTKGTLKVAIGNGLEDYAGFNLIPKSFDIKVVEDTNPPKVIGYKNATRQQVTLIFDEDIQIEEVNKRNYYHTSKVNYIDKDIDEKTDLQGSELTLHFKDNLLFEGEGYVYISPGSVTDLWDNENETIKARILVKADKIAPTIKGVKYDSDENKIIVTFSESMAKRSAEDIDNYTLLAGDGSKLRIIDSVLNQDEVTLELKDSKPAYGTYKLTVQDTEDLAGNKIAKATVNVVIDDTQAPRYPHSIYYEGSGSHYTLYVEFNEEMSVSGSYSIKDLYKYEIYDESANKNINLGRAKASGDFSVNLNLMAGNKTVRLEIDGFKLDPDADTFLIARVADVRGNYTEGFGSSKLDFVAMENKTIALTPGGVLATGRTTLEIEFDGNLDSYNIGDFFIEVGGEASAYNIATLKVKDANKIVMTIDEDTPLPADLKEGKKSLYLATRGGTGDKDYRIGTKSAAGAKLKAGQSEPIVDNIKPGLVTEDKKKTSIPYVSAKRNGTENGVPVVYATYYEDTDLTFVTAEFAEPLKAIDEKLIMVNDGHDELIVGGVLKDGTAGTLKFIVEGQLFRGDDIKVLIIRDEAGNYTTNLTFQIEYKVAIER